MYVFFSKKMFIFNTILSGTVYEVNKYYQDFQVNYQFSTQLYF